jgi:hypothetical protein
VQTTSRRLKSDSAKRTDTKATGRFGGARSESGALRASTLDRGFESRSGHGSLFFPNVCRKSMIKENPKIKPNVPSRDKTYKLKLL